MSKFKIKGVGLDTTTLDFSPSISINKFDYIHTSLRANNDYLLGEYLLRLTSDNEANLRHNTPLVVSVDFLDNVEIALMGHLSELLRESAELILLNPKCNFEEFQETLIRLKDSNIVDNYGIDFPESLEELKNTIDILKCFGLEAKYVSLKISPFEFNKDIIKYCEDNNIVILGFNSFGGHLTAPSLIDSFTVPYLLEFAAAHSDIVFLSGRDLYNSISNKKYIEFLINKEADLSKYTLNKNINKLIKPLKKTVYTGFKFDDGSLLPYDNPDFVITNPGSLEIKFEKNILPEIKNSIPEPGSIEESVYTLFKTFHRPIDGNDDDFFAIIRYQIKKVFIDRFLKDWTIMFANIGTRILVFNITKSTFISGGWFRKDKIEKETRSFLMYYLNGTFLFKEVKMDLEKPEVLKNEK